MGSKVDKFLTAGLVRETKRALDTTLPQPTEPEAAPVPDDEELARAARRKEARRAKAGRAGTLLTEGSTLG